MAVITASDVWAVGDTTNSSGDSQTLIERWDGAAWSVVPSPNPGPSLNFLHGAAADPLSGQTWAVGVFFDASGTSLTLAEFHP